MVLPANFIFFGRVLEIVFEMCQVRTSSFKPADISDQMYSMSVHVSLNHLTKQQKKPLLRKIHTNIRVKMKEHWLSLIC